jgi:aspartate/tyrosine/aromatic aminotransferase
VDFDGMVEDLRQAPENSVIILQACAHNPTGCDLTKEQWIKVADIVQVTTLCILDIHQQNAQITNKVQSALYHSQTLHMFRLFMSHHQGFSQ